MVNIEIDGKAVEVESGFTIMDAANKAGVYIPHFCYHKKLSIAANCRMCLVQVDKSPKPLPACATPVTDGMKVMTRSSYAIEAQKGVMEFLLINHPLDCPICDQGGECSLQDLAVGYGASNSRYQEVKRVVTEKDLGPLVATDMTRCINCTRCVRFGQEIAGIMEMGQAFRGEHAEIMPFINQTINSELSGNIIDLCPVGALTSKPFRYSARTWELSRRKSVSPHDGLGSNLQIQIKNDRVMRVLPLENESLNECWLSDRDRFSYEGLNVEERLSRPMIKKNGQWVEAEWSVALEHVAHVLKSIAHQHGAEQIGALATAYQTVEELYLLQKLVRGLGSGNVDHRLRQSDFALDAKAQGVFWLGMKIEELSDLKRILVVGSNLRKEHPLIALRLRQTVKKNRADLNLISPVDEDLYCAVANKAIVAPERMAHLLAQVLKALTVIKGAAAPLKLGKVTVSASARAIAQSLNAGGPQAVLLGNLAQHHPAYGQIHYLAETLAEFIGASFGVLGEAGNSVGALVAGAVPAHGPLGKASLAGLNARAMLEQPRKAYVLLGAEPELDCNDGALAMRALAAAEFTVALSAYKHKALDYADVMLPIAPFTETTGTFINMEGRVQRIHGVVKPRDGARPAWKVFRVLGNLLRLEGFDQDTADAVARDALGDDAQAAVNSLLNNSVSPIALDFAAADAKLHRIGEVPLYQSDAIVRRAPSLQHTHDAALPAAHMAGGLISRLGLEPGGMAAVHQGHEVITLKVAQDDRLPDNCVRIAAGHPVTAELGPMFGEISVERA
ncbi:MAG TPA: NADH-quinone oxidoreductase subunit NuoG [Thiobacillaceae bacterium]|nr:NADH-quinone oxidoreductase subunit NuoG [Thiobacillaceae bacterium]